MSSDEKALEQICYCGHPKERHSRKCKEERDRKDTSYYVSACYHCVCKEYANNELLETHTVKEVCRCRSGELNDGGKWASWSKDNCPVHPDKSPFDKEEPTTPEKKCCENCNGSKNKSNSISPVCSGFCPCHQEVKLSTSSYKVTCGICGVKHSCGRV